MTGASEPAGLGMSLDDLIKKEKPSGGPGRGAGRGLAAQGGVQKPGRGLGRGAGRASDGGGRGGPRAAFVGGRGGGRTGMHEGVAHSGGRGGAMQSGGPSGAEVEVIRLRAQVAQQQVQIKQQQDQIMALTHQIGMALAAQAGGAVPIPARAINQQQGGARQNRAPIVPELEPLEMDQDVLQNMEIKELANGDFEVLYQGLAIAIISLDGSLVLKTQGWYDLPTLNAINYTLRPLQMEVTFTGDVEVSNWTLNMPPNGNRRFTDGMQVPPRGPGSAGRAVALLRTFQGLVQITRNDHDAARRMAAQGRAAFAY